MVLNLHGLNGSSHNTNYRLLIEQYSYDYVISPQINYAVTSPKEILNRLKEYKNIDYVVGNSFGGFFAYVLSYMLHIRCLLVNPCIPPERYIPSLVEEYTFTEELANLIDGYFNNTQPVYMILCMDDDVLSPDYTEKIVKVTKLWKIHGGHSLSGNKQFSSVFLEAVTEMDNEKVNNKLFKINSEIT